MDINKITKTFKVIFNILTQEQENSFKSNDNSQRLQNYIKSLFQRICIFVKQIHKENTNYFKVEDQHKFMKQSKDFKIINNECEVEQNFEINNNKLDDNNTYVTQKVINRKIIRVKNLKSKIIDFQKYKDDENFMELQNKYKYQLREIYSEYYSENNIYPSCHETKQIIKTKVPFLLSARIIEVIKLYNHMNHYDENNRGKIRSYSLDYLSGKNQALSTSTLVKQSHHLNEILLEQYQKHKYYPPPTIIEKLMLTKYNIKIHRSQAKLQLVSILNKLNISTKENQFNQVNRLSHEIISKIKEIPDYHNLLTTYSTAELFRQFKQKLKILPDKYSKNQIDKIRKEILNNSYVWDDSKYQTVGTKRNKK